MSVEFACGGTGVAKGRIRQVLDPPGPRRSNFLPAAEESLADPDSRLALDRPRFLTKLPKLTSGH
jgi:hypothetical protein